VRVIRSEGDHGELFVVDADAIMNGEAAPFELAPGDVVFVSPTGFASWNQALGMLLPSLQTVAGILEPFVQSSTSQRSEAPCRSQPQKHRATPAKARAFAVHTAGPTADADGLEVFQLLTILRQNRRHIFKIAAVCCVLALAFKARVVLRFESTARVYLGELESRNAPPFAAMTSSISRAPATATPQPSSRFSTAET